MIRTETRLWRARRPNARSVVRSVAAVTALLPGLAACIAAERAVPPCPHIVVILSDDMGFSDVGCYGSEIETPNIDRLARGGLRFTQFYNAARCCPTRASLLTGLYPHQAGVGDMTEDRGLPGYRGDLNDRCVTIAEALSPAGYTSYAAGKWHVTSGKTPARDKDTRNWPLQRGFSRFYGTIIGAGNFFDPATLVRDNRMLSAFSDPDYPSEDYYYTDAISDHAVRFIREHDATTPFFLYVAYTAAHWPLHARDRDIAKYAGRYAAGYDAIRQARYAKMLTEGVVTAAETALCPWPPTLGEKEEWLAWDRRNMEVYAAMVDSMDQGIGRIVKAIEDAGQADNTLVVFLHDNGGCAEGMGRRGLGRARAEAPTMPPLSADDVTLTVRQPQTRDGYPIREGRGVMAGPADTFIAYGHAWATVSNVPFRKYKHFVHEGGIATPLIVHWPRGINEPGRLERTPGHLIDIMATAVDVAGVSYPSDKTPLEGKSLRPLFAGGSLDREAIYWEHEGNKAVREGDWKLVAAHGERWELYDLSKDRSEQNDLSGVDPERVRRMAAMWNAYAARTNVEPWEAVLSRKKQQ
jgi:arylsulfatase A-like enzyme